MHGDPPKTNVSFLAQFAFRRSFGRTLFYGIVFHIITFFVLLPIIGRNLPHSKYFHFSQPIEIQLYDKIGANKQRSEFANRYFESVEPRKTINYHSEKLARRPDIVIGVISVARNMYRSRKIQPYYLTQVMARLDIILKTTKNADAGVFICNVNSNPIENQEAEILASFFPRFRKFNVPRKPPPNNMKRDHLFEKKKSDHIFCLNKALTYKPKYVLLLEDDALPRADFYQKLRYLLRNQLENRIVQGESALSPPWAWIKLCYPEENADFPENGIFIIEWLCSSAYVSGLCALFFYFLYPRKSVYEHYLVLSMGFAFFFLFFWAIGRQHFVNILYSSEYFVITRPDPATACCTQAVLYPASVVPDLTNYLNMKLCSERFPLESALQQYAAHTHSKGYLSVPNLFNHIGLYSSLPTT